MKWFGMDFDGARHKPKLPLSRLAFMGQPDPHDWSAWSKTGKGYNRPALDRVRGHNGPARTSKKGRRPRD
jgi:hypothetical protein